MGWADLTVVSVCALGAVADAELLEGLDARTALVVPAFHLPSSCASAADCAELLQSAGARAAPPTPSAVDPATCMLTCPALPMAAGGKARLRQLWQAGSARGFMQCAQGAACTRAYWQGHHATDYPRWFAANETYRIEYENVRCPALPAAAAARCARPARAPPRAHRDLSPTLLPAAPRSLITMSG